MQREVAHRYVPEDDLRELLTGLLDVLQKRGRGVLMTVDEMNRHATEDLRAITQVVQHCFREGRDLAFPGAGLPIEVAALLDEPGTTFLRRAEEVALGVISDHEVHRGLVEPLTTWGRQIDPDALDIAVAGVKGYPFLLQAIGHRLWALSTPEAPIGASIALAAVDYANRRIWDLAMAPELKGLSPIDRSYLAAMSIDAGPSRTRDIAERLGVSPQYANTYRTRLIAAGLIEEAGHGAVEFVLPALRDYLREHTVAEPLSAGKARASPASLSGMEHARRGVGPDQGPEGPGPGPTR